MWEYDTRFRLRGSLRHFKRGSRFRRRRRRNKTRVRFPGKAAVPHMNFFD
jgi:hypothetical protein